MTNMADVLLEEVKQAFARELEAGTLTIVEHQYYAHAFGDAFVLLEGSGLRLQLKRERLQPYALMAPVRDPEDWARLQAVVSAVTGTKVHGAVEAVGWELSVSEAASLFRRHERDLVRAYRSWWSWRPVRKKLRALEKAQQDRLDAWIAAPKSAAEKLLDEAADRALENPSDGLKAALKAMGIDK